MKTFKLKTAELFKFWNFVFICVEKKAIYFNIAVTWREV